MLLRARKNLSAIESSTVAVSDQLVVGESAAIGHLREAIDAAARSNANVLITGEPGSGKKLVACAIHRASSRAARPLLLMSCSGLPDVLLESELVGHVRGAFKGALRDKMGSLTVAATGTLVLAHIDDMPLRAQGLVLRFLETGEVQRLGSGSIERPIDGRLMATTSRSLLEMVRDGRFREELYRRLNSIYITVPALRHHKEDIPRLMSHIWRSAVRTPLAPVEPRVMQAFVEYSWPGNAIELQRVVGQLAATCPDGVVRVSDLPSELRKVLDVRRRH
jgi:two-component system, NtrC family, response regulator AtoC